MKYKGDNMRENRSLDVFDRVLDYIQDEINEPEKADIVEDLMDIHTLLTSLKCKRMESTKTEETSDSDLYMYAYLVINAFGVVFGNWESKTKVIDGRVLLHNDIVYMDINHDDPKVTECIVSFYHEAEPVIVAECINTLKDIFGAGLKVSSEVFTIDEATGGYLWGMEAIKQHLRNISGRKIRPIMFWDDDTIGNC